MLRIITFYIMSYLIKKEVITLSWNIELFNLKP